MIYENQFIFMLSNSFKLELMKQTLTYLFGIFSIVLSGQNTLDDFYSDIDNLFAQNVLRDGTVDYNNLKQLESFDELIDFVSNFDSNPLTGDNLKAFYINAYNLNVIDQVLENYPIQSVLDIPNFFDQKNITVSGTRYSLNQFEKEIIFEQFSDPRLHFALVCAAKSCPPLSNLTFRPEDLEKQLSNLTKTALNSRSIVNELGGQIFLSKIFDWYSKDFGKNNQDIIGYINKNGDRTIDGDAGVKYMTYDWTLNDVVRVENLTTKQSTNNSRYVVSSTIPKGTYEIKLFNNLYSQKNNFGGTLTNRSSFFTTTLTALYGLSPRLNIGINTRFRKVRNNALPSSPFSVFGSDLPSASRSGLTGFGPMIRYAPVPQWSNFSIQSSFVFAIGSDLAGGNDRPYIDWNGPTWWTQIFNDFNIGDKFSLFTELDFLLEDIGGTSSGHINRFSTPLTTIFSYIPTTKLVVYALAGYSPYWQEDYDYFYQYGIGSKYQFTPKFEIEVLYTDFTNEFLSQSSGKAETINFGIRVNI